jgi:hypothetical protein
MDRKRPLGFGPSTPPPNATVTSAYTYLQRSSNRQRDSNCYQDLAKSELDANHHRVRRLWKGTASIAVAARKQFRNQRNRQRRDVRPELPQFVLHGAVFGISAPPATSGHLFTHCDTMWRHPNLLQTRVRQCDQRPSETDGVLALSLPKGDLVLVAVPRLRIANALVLTPES